ncbi:hypothetical protein ACJX0J_023645, partial [Zea mays]
MEEVGERSTLLLSFSSPIVLLDIWDQHRLSSFIIFVQLILNGMRVLYIWGSITFEVASSLYSNPL